ncbi:MAG: dephospho-CoA kinase [Arcanobacterium sp.]|nr:dephospho-CoA kinase [Arcanobacterium sp.]
MVPYAIGRGVEIMRVFVLTGGIASGKSTVASLLAAKGAKIIDFDRLAREIVRPGLPALRDIAQRFGADVITDSGELDRSKLAHVVFNDSTALHDLNAITHPRIRERAREELTLLEISNEDGIVILDIPIFTPDALDLHYDGVLLVTSTQEIRVNRMMHFRGMSREDAEARIAAQPSEEELRAYADRVINNNSTQVELAMQVDQLWNDFICQGEPSA